MRLRYFPAAALLGLVVLAGCGSTHHASGPTTLPPASTGPQTSAPPTTAKVTTPTTVTKPTTVAKPTPSAATGAPGASSTTAKPSTAVANPLALVAGTYDGRTAAAGWVYLGDSGTGVVRGPDRVACPTCGLASAPIATLDFSFAEIGSPTKLAATVTSASDPAWASHLVPSGKLSFTVEPNRSLTATSLPGTYDWASTGELYSNMAACTVAAVAPPVEQADAGQQVSVNGVTCSKDGEWAEAAVTAHGKGGGFDEDALLAGSRSNWFVVDRATVCAHHEIGKAFYPTACG